MMMMVCSPYLTSASRQMEMSRMVMIMARMIHPTRERAVPVYGWGWGLSWMAQLSGALQSKDLVVGKLTLRQQLTTAQKHQELVMRTYSLQKRIMIFSSTLGEFPGWGIHWLQQHKKRHNQACRCRCQDCLWGDDGTIQDQNRTTTD